MVPKTSLLFDIAILVDSAVPTPGLFYKGLAQTPQFAWDTCNAYDLDYNDPSFRTNAEHLVAIDFRDQFYRVVICDDAMTELKWSPDGNLIANSEKFPNGLEPVVEESRQDPGCQFWAWLGAGYLKYDNCHNEGNSGTPSLSEHRYAIMSNALNSTGRNFTYSLCNWGDDKPWEWASTIANSARMSGDITDSFNKISTSCPCGPDEYYCQLPGYGCSVLNILGKASHIVSKNQPGYWNDLDMLEVGNGGMDYDEYKTHFSMWAAIKSPLIMGNKLDQLTPEDYGILTNPAVLAISQDPMGSAIGRTYVRQLPESERDEYGYGEIQVWSGSLFSGDQVVAFVNAASTPQTVTASLVQIFGGITNSEKSQTSWEMYDVWGNETVMGTATAEAVLNGSIELSMSDSNSIQGYYNATRMSWAEGLARNDSRLLGTRVGSVRARGSITTEVPRHGIAMWRLRNMGGGGMKRDEL